MGGIKQNLDSQRRTVEQTINAVKAAGIAPGSRSVVHSKGIADKKHNYYETVKSPTMTSGQEEEMAALRRKLHNHILKN